MELLIAAVVTGVVIAVALAVTLWKVIARAVDNAFDWLISTFGNERASREVEERRRRRT